MQDNKPTSLEYIGIGLVIGILIGGLIGLCFMVYFLEQMKEVGVKPRDQIIEYMNRQNNKHYQYEKGDEYIDSVYIKGVRHWNGSMISPPICYGPMCPYNYTGVVIK